MRKKVSARQSPLEILPDDDIFAGANTLSGWEAERADLLRRMDRIVANQKEMDGRLWVLEDSRVFRILQGIARSSSGIKSRIGRLLDPKAVTREKQRAYQLWLENQAPRKLDLSALSYRPRFKVLAVGGDSRAGLLNRAAHEADSDYLVLLSSNSRLTPNALFEISAELQRERFDVLYGDEDHLSASGERQDPVFKPGWSPDLIFSPLYMGGFLVVANFAFKAAGGFREGAHGAYIFDLALRLAEQLMLFHHVPRILVSSGGDCSTEEGRRRALDHFASGSVAVGVEPSGTEFPIRRKVRGTPLVSIVICSRRAALLKKCLDVIEKTTTYTHRETIVVEHLADDKNNMDSLLSKSSCIRVQYSGCFDFASMNNAGVKAAKGDVIVFINDDVRPLNAEWLEAMLAQAQRPEVGVVGALLLYPSGAIQHAGIAIGLMGAAGHPGRGTFDGGFWPWTTVTRNVSAVTGACIAMRREVFEELGGFNPLFPVNYNDVDLCLRARRAGYEVILEAGARLCHLESGTRSLGVAWEERERFAERWGEQIAQPDPYYSPRLTVRSEDCSLAGF